MQNNINQSALSDNSLLKYIEIKINELTLTDEDLMSCEISWDSSKFGIEGNILIKDNLDILNQIQPNYETTLTIYAKDSFDNFFQKEFRIVKSEELFVNKIKMLNFTFIDNIYYVLNSTYISKSYCNTTLTDILNDYLKYLNLETNTNFTITNKIEFIVVPQHISFLEWFLKELEKEGCTIYQDRYGMHLKKYSELYPTKLETLDKVDNSNISHKLTQNVPSEHYIFKIHELKINFNNLLNKPPISSYKFYNFDKKTIQEHNSTLKDVYTNYKLNTYDNSDMQTNYGIKYNTQQHSTSNYLEKELSVFSKNENIEVILYGNIKYNKFYFNYNVDLAGSLNHIQGRNEGNIVQSGIYTCYKVQDKFIGGKLIQKLSLSRIDFTEKR